MSEAEKLAEAIRRTISAHKAATVFESISACEVVKLELFEMLPMSGVCKSATMSATPGNICANCDFWEQHVSGNGLCRLFVKQTNALHGAKCTAWIPRV